MTVQFNQIRATALSIAQEAGQAIDQAVKVAAREIQNIDPQTVKKVAWAALGILYTVVAPVPTSAGFVLGMAYADKVKQSVARIKSVYAKQNLGVKVLMIAASWVLFSATFPVLPGLAVGLVAGAHLRK
jgi:hypothetical protein